MADSIIQDKLVKIAEIIVNPLIELAFAVAVIVFVWGIWEYFFKKVDGSEREKGRLHILWGIVGIGIMMGAYGIINIVINTVGADKGEFDTNFSRRDNTWVDLFKK